MHILLPFSPAPNSCACGYVYKFAFCLFGHGVFNEIDRVGLTFMIDSLLFKRSVPDQKKKKKKKLDSTFLYDQSLISQ